MRFSDRQHRNETMGATASSGAAMPLHAPVALVDGPSWSRGRILRRRGRLGTLPAAARRRALFVWRNDQGARSSGLPGSPGSVLTRGESDDRVCGPFRLSANAPLPRRTILTRHASLMGAISASPSLRGFLAASLTRQHSNRSPMFDGANRSRAFGPEMSGSSHSNTESVGIITGGAVVYFRDRRHRRTSEDREPLRDFPQDGR